MDTKKKKNAQKSILINNNQKTHIIRHNMPQIHDVAQN